jgi:hypothetical protein
LFLPRVVLASGWFAAKWKLRQREQLQRNETLRILAQKFNTAEEFVGFVNSDVGRRERRCALSLTIVDR